NDEVRSLISRALSFCERVRRYSDLEPCGTDPPRVSSRDRAGLEMHTIGSRRQGYVEPVVDEHPGSVWPRYFEDSPHELLQLSCSEVGLADLHEINSARGGLASTLELRQVVRPVRTAAERPSICDQIEQQRLQRQEV